MSSKRRNFWGAFGRRYKLAIARLQKKMGNLKSSSRATDNEAVGSPGDDQIVLHFPDHKGRAYTVSRQFVMRDCPSVLNVNITTFPDVACLNSKMDAIKDVVFMQDNINFWCSQLHLYEKQGQTIAGTNPQILEANHRSGNTYV